MVFQGPIRPGTSEKVFRETGRSQNLFQGPVRPGDDVSVFRETGRTISRGGGSGGGSSSPAPQLGPTRAELEAEQKRQAELKRQQAEAKKLADQLTAEKNKKIQSQKIGGQVGGMNNANKNIPTFGTVQNYGKQELPKYNIYTEPTIEQRQIDTVKDSSGRSIPVMGTFLIKPPTGSLGGITKETQIYPSAVTPSGNVFKIEGYEDVTIEKELEASSDKRSVTVAKTKDAVFGAYNKAEGNLRTTFTDPLGSLIVESTKGTRVGGETGLTIEKAKSNIRESTDYLISGKYPKFAARTGEFIAGAGIGIVEDVKYKPGKQIAILGVSGGLGYGLGALNVGVAGSSTALFGKTTGSLIGSGFKVAQVGGGLYLGAGFVGATATSVGAKIKKGDYLGAGSITGVAVKDLGLGAYGFKSGQKLFTQTRGYLATRGREELITQQGEYPTAPTSKQLQMFKKNIIPELGDKPGAFHTTPDIFYKNGKIVPQAGTSELPGLYGSTQISTPFARIVGSSNNAKLFPNLKNIFQTPGKPGVAFLKPTGFRYSATTKNPSIIDGQKFSYQFVKGAKPGYADVPLIKTEIEAVFRPDAGNYLFESGKYFTRIKGVRVPIDVFGYDASVVTTPATTGLNLLGGRSGGITSYSAVPSYPLVSPEIGFIFSSSSAGKSYTPPTSIAKLTSSFGASSGKSSSIMPSSIGRSYGQGSSSLRKYYGGSSILSGSSSASSLSKAFGSSYGGGSSSSLIPPRSPAGLLPKFPRIGEKAKRKPQIFKQPTLYQPSFSGSILGISGKGLLPGGLSIRGIL